MISVLTFVSGDGYLQAKGIFKDMLPSLTSLVEILLFLKPI